jgi:hypothetical protein
MTKLKSRRQALKDGFRQKNFPCGGYFNYDKPSKRVSDKKISLVVVILIMTSPQRGSPTKKNP